MKRITTILLLCMTAFGVFAETRSEPQIAYRILNDYVSRKQSSADNRAWAGVMLGIGGTLVAGSAVSWFLGDAISQAVAPGNTVWTEDTRTVTSLVIAGSGIATGTVGLIGLTVPSVDYRKKYVPIYEEKDAVVQEALAVASLKELADIGRERRITSAVINIGTPLAIFLVQTILNVSTGKEWYHGYQSVGSWQIPSVVSAAGSLFSVSDEERLFEKYQAARAAIYAVQ